MDITSVVAGLLVGTGLAGVGAWVGGAALLILLLSRAFELRLSKWVRIGLGLILVLALY